MYPFPFSQTKIFRKINKVKDQAKFWCRCFRGKSESDGKHGSLRRDMNPPDLWIHHGLVGSGDKAKDDDNVGGAGRPSSRGNRSDRSSENYISDL